MEDLRVFDYAQYTEKQHTLADRAGPLLARLIRDAPSPTPILEIKLQNDSVVRTQIEINKAFSEYYGTLYCAPPAPNYVEYDSFFDKISSHSC